MLKQPRSGRKFNENKNKWTGKVIEVESSLRKRFYRNIIFTMSMACDL